MALGDSPASSHAGSKRTGASLQIAAIYFVFLGVKWMKICTVMHHRQVKSHETSADGHLINVTDVPWQGPKRPALWAAVCVGGLVGRGQNSVLVPGSHSLGGSRGAQHPAQPPGAASNPGFCSPVSHTLLWQPGGSSAAAKGGKRV